MSDTTPPDSAGGAPPSSGTTLSSARIPVILGEFQRWLEEQAQTSENNGHQEQAEAEEIDLATLLGQMIAIRQETNLLTRATRNQQEQNERTLTELSSTLQMLQRSQAAARQAQEANLEEQARPLLRTLVDLYEVLSLSSDQIQRAREAVLPRLEGLIERISTHEVAPLPEVPQQAPGGWLSFRRRQTPENAIARQLREMLVEDRRFHTETETEIHEVVENLRGMVSSLSDGYQLSLQRLRRTLDQHGLEPMSVVGEQFDPEQMEVIGHVTEGNYEPGEVVEEVSRGYLWRGRVFRFAKVRVAKPGA